MPIRAKLVIVVFVFAIMPMFLLWARWQGTAVGRITSILQQDIANRSREISEQVDRKIREHQLWLSQLAQQEPLIAYARALAQNTRALPEGQLRVELSAFVLAHQQQYAALLGLNRAGATLFKIEAQPGDNGFLRAFITTQNFADGDTVKAAAAFTAAPANAAHVSEIETTPEGSFLWLIVPLRDNTNETTGALAARLRADYFLTEAVGPRSAAITNPGNQAGPRARESVVISPAGAVLYAADASRQGKPYAEAFPGFATAFGTLMQGGKDDLQGQEWIIRHRLHNAAPKLSILVLERYDQTISGLERDSLIMFLVTALLATVAALTVYYLISGITNSIRRVTFGAKAIASGDLSHRIIVQTNDETRVLAHAFNRMAAKLREMLKKEGEQKQFESFARLSAVLTHDLKNQILSLSLLVNNMEKKFHREGFREDAMRTLSDTVDNLQNLVAKLSDPRTPTKRVRDQADLTGLVERVLQRTAKQAPSRFNLTAKLMPEVKATVDGKAIERVIENLVINALEAMPDGGSLYVLTTVEHDNAVISIADTGKGMTEEFMRTRLYHPFATTKKKGIGLGLYSCREIVEQHGGHIDVTSQVDVGTEFRVVLPLNGTESIPKVEKQVAAV
jgi:signal transduction histidine kinase